MKVVILAGGFGTRLSEETESIPKPMVEIGGMPILWHIMKGYEAYGYREFVVATGYKGHVIKSFFADYSTRRGSFVVSTKLGGIVHHEPAGEDWVVHLCDTGLEASTGDRLLALKPILKDDDHFLLTYGDGLSDVDVSALVRAHIEGRTERDKPRIATVTAVQPKGRFGVLDVSTSADGEVSWHVDGFHEKIDERWVNGGFMAMSKEIFDHLPGPGGVLENALAAIVPLDGLGAYLHDGYWQCMDTLRDKRELEALWAQKKAPWIARWKKTT